MVSGENENAKHCIKKSTKIIYYYFDLVLSFYEYLTAFAYYALPRVMGCLGIVHFSHPFAIQVIRAYLIKAYSLSTDRTEHLIIIHLSNNLSLIVFIQQIKGFIIHTFKCNTTNILYIDSTLFF